MNQSNLHETNMPPQPKLQLYMVRCKSGFFRTHKSVYVQQNSHALTNLFYDFFRRWPGFDIISIHPTDLFIIQ